MKQKRVVDIFKHALATPSVVYHLEYQNILDHPKNHKKINKIHKDFFFINNFLT